MFSYYLLIGVITSAICAILRKYRHYLRKSALIYMKTTTYEKVELERLLQMPATDSVYRILYNVDSHMGTVEETYHNKWDHVVFAHQFHDDCTRMKYIETLKDHPFVEDVEVVVLAPRLFPGYVVINVFISVWKVVSHALGNRPLQKSDSPAFQCTHEMESDPDPVMLFNLLRITDNQIFREYAGVMFTKLFPVLGARIYYSGQPEGDRWNKFSMVRYPSHSCSCELAQSVIFSENVQVKKKCVTDTFTHVAKRICCAKEKKE